VRLKDRVALVTGANSGFGRAIALGFAREGADVAINYLVNPQAAEEVVREIEAMGRRATAVQADISDRSQVEAMVSGVLESFGRIDVLVNNAGLTIRMPFLELTEEAWDQVLDVDLKGPFLVSQAVARHMAGRGGGAIVNISSMSAQVAQPGITHYQAAKAGVTMLTRGMAFELGQYGIRVNAIEPGTIPTDFNRARLSAPEAQAELLGKIPLGRMGEPRDLVGAAVYLASEESSFTTGAVIRIDGGMTLGSLY
jgi:glucose 1-dehydrogenase